MSHKTRLAHNEAKKYNTINGRCYKYSYHAHANVSADANGKMKD